MTKIHEQETDSSLLLEKLFPRKLMPFLITISIALAVIGYVAVEVSFSSVNFPGTLFETQLAFDADVLKRQYAHLIEQGNMNAYIRTQFIDFIFIVGLALAGFTGHVAISRAFAAHSLGHRVPLLIGWLFVGGALLDALENFTSFAMLSNPTDFPSWLAILYSSFAALKWILAGIGIVCVLVELSVLLLKRHRIAAR